MQKMLSFLSAAVANATPAGFHPHRKNRGDVYGIVRDRARHNLSTDLVGVIAFLKENTRI